MSNVIKNAIKAKNNKNILDNNKKLTYWLMDINRKIYNQKLKLSNTNFSLI